MSANKKATVQINRREYERLRQLERSSMFPPIAQTPGFSSVIENTLTGQMDELERRQQEYQRIISGMGNEIQTLENDATEALITQQQLFLQEIESVEQGLSWNTEQLLARQAEFFNETIRTNELQFEDNLEELHAVLGQFADDNHRKREMSENLIHEIDAIWNWHLQEYNWVQFLPDTLTGIEDNLELISRNFELGNYEASLMLSQQSLKTIQRARIELEKKESEWNLLCETVKQEASRLFHLAVEHRTVLPVDAHGNLLEHQDEINVNYWSNGELQNFIATMRTILFQIRDHRETMTVKGLQEWLDYRLPVLEEELLDIVMMARENVIDSQLRTNITNVIIATMKQQGFEAVDIEDHSNEIRQPNRLIMRNLTGDEVYVELNPDMNQIGKNHISINSAETHSMSEYELTQRRNQITETLGTYGVEIEVEGDMRPDSEPITPRYPGTLKKKPGQPISPQKVQKKPYVPPARRPF